MKTALRILLNYRLRPLLHRVLPVMEAEVERPDMYEGRVLFHATPQRMIAALRYAQQRGMTITFEETGIRAAMVRRALSL